MRKIYFNDMVQQTRDVIEGRVTQIRQIITCPNTFRGKQVAGFHVYKRKSDGLISEICLYDEDERDFDEGQIVPRYKAGEVVAVAQSYKTIREALPYSERAKFYCDVVKAHFPDSATHKDYDEIAGWHNKMFVKAEYMPHKICIKSVRVERLRDISDEDCLNEGIIKRWHAPAGRNYYYIPNVEVKSTRDVYDSPKEAYASMIEKVCGRGTWARDPYVWVYDFELLK